MHKLDYQSLIEGLSKVLAPSIWWVENDTIESNLGISESTRKRDLRLLTNLDVIPPKPRRTGLTRQEYLSLLAFRTIQKISDRDTAAEIIPQIKEEIFNAG